ncbi:hypothetical protein J1614_000075 [Plenodomus biglobosus]|nr:hypothetical protein J1614_000075 [Plenodomus biglobosus]
MAALLGAALFIVAQLWVSQPATIGVAIIAMDIGVIVPHFAPTFEKADYWFKNYSPGSLNTAGKVTETTSVITASRMDAVIGAEPDPIQYDRTLLLQNGDTVIYDAPITILDERITFPPRTITANATDYKPITTIIQLGSSLSLHSSSRHVERRPNYAISGKGQDVNGRATNPLSSALNTPSKTWPSKPTRETKPATSNINDLAKPPSSTKMTSPITTPSGSFLHRLADYFRSSSNEYTTHIKTALKPSRDEFTRSISNFLSLRIASLIQVVRLAADSVSARSTEWALNVCEQCRAMEEGMAHISCLVINTGLLIVMCITGLLIRAKLQKAFIVVWRCMIEQLRALRLRLARVGSAMLEYWNGVLNSVLEVIPTLSGRPGAWCHASVPAFLYRAWNSTFTCLFQIWIAITPLQTFVLQQIIAIVERLRHFYTRFRISVPIHFLPAGLSIQRAFQILAGMIRQRNKGLQAVKLWLGGLIDWLLQIYPIFGSIVMTVLSMVIGLYVIQPFLDELWDLVAMHVPGLPFGEDAILKYLPQWSLKSWAVGRLIQRNPFHIKVWAKMPSECYRDTIVSIFAYELWQQVVQWRQWVSYYSSVSSGIFRYHVRDALSVASLCLASISSASRIACQTITTKLVPILSFPSSVYGSGYSQASNCSISWKYLVMVLYLTFWTSCLVLVPYSLRHMRPSLWSSAIIAAALLAFRAYRRECAQDHVIIFATLLFWFLVWWVSRPIFTGLAAMHNHYNGKPEAKLLKHEHRMMQQWPGTTVPEEKGLVARSDDATRLTSPPVRRRRVRFIDDKETAPVPTVEADDFEPYIPPRRPLAARRLSKSRSSGSWDHIPFYFTPDITPTKEPASSDRDGDPGFDPVTENGLGNHLDGNADASTDAPEGPGSESAVDGPTPHD